MIQGSGRRSAARKLAHVVSARFFADLLTSVKALADEDEVSVSDWVRNATAAEVYRRELLPAPAPETGYKTAGWQCPHLSVTSTPGVFGMVRAGCGCKMQPILVAA